MTANSMWIERVNAKAIQDLKELVGTGEEIILQLVAGDEMSGYLTEADDDGNFQFAQIAVGGHSDGKIIRRIRTNYLRVVYFGEAVVEDRPEGWLRKS